MRNTIFILLLLICNFCFSQKFVLDKAFRNTKTDVEMAVIIINNQNNIIDQAFTYNVAEVLKNSKGYKTNPSFFNTEFIKNGEFEKIFNGDRIRIKKLHLKNKLDYLCFGKYQIKSISKNEFDLITADVYIILNIIYAKSGAIVNSQTNSIRGIGVTKNDAIQNALLKFTKQLK